MLTMLGSKPAENNQFCLAIIGSRGTIFGTPMVEALDYLILDLDRFDYAVDLGTGCAAGADTCARMYAEMRDWDCEVFYAEWKRYGKKAGFLRNELMAQWADGVVACPKDPTKISSGTMHMINISHGLGKRVWILNHDGSISRYSPA